MMVCHATYLFPHRLLFGRHVSTWPGDDHATSRGLSRRSSSLLLLHNQPLRGVRMTMPRDLMYPLPLNALRVPGVILLPRAFCYCCKLLPTIMLQPLEFVLHCPRLYSRRMILISIAHGSIPTEGLLAVASPVAAPLPKTGPDGCLLYTSPSPRDKRQSRMPSSA